MKKIIFLISLLLLFFCRVTAQEVVVAKHTFEKSLDKNEYKIISEYSGVEGADFVKVRYRIPPGINVITPSLSSSLSKKEEDGASYYIYSIKKGVATTTFYIQPENEEDVVIKIDFNYALGNDNRIVAMEDLVIHSEKEYAVHTEEIPEDNTLVINELEVESDPVEIIEPSDTISWEHEHESVTDNVDPTDNIDPDHNVETNDNIDPVDSTHDPVVIKTVKQIYSIQLLSLSRYSDERVMKFCFDHKVINGELIKRNVAGIIKISIGRYASKDEAYQAKAAMIDNDAVLHDAFVIPLR